MLGIVKLTGKGDRESSIIPDILCGFLFLPSFSLDPIKEI